MIWKARFIVVDFQTRGVAWASIVVSSRLFLSLVLARLPLARVIAALIAARAFGLGGIRRIGTARQKCASFHLPGFQRLKHRGSFVGHGFGKVEVFIRIDLQVVEFTMASAFKKLDPLEVAIANGARRS